jgi:hypothetical protein
MASQTQNIGNSVVQQFFPALLNGSGFYCFYMFMGVNLLLAVFVWYCIPETKGVALEEMDVLFGGANHVVGGAELIDLGKAGGGEEHMGRNSEAREEVRDEGLPLGDARERVTPAGAAPRAAERGGGPPSR